MDIGPNKEEKVVEPIKSPVPRRVPAPSPEPETVPAPEPERVREPEKV